MRALAFLLVFSQAACSSVEFERPVLSAKNGPAFEKRVHRIVALPASCAAVAIDYRNADPDQKGRGPYSRCPLEGLVAIDEAIRGTLEFQGHHVIDAERVNRETANRVEILQRHDLRTTTTIELSRSLFADATPSEQRDILRAVEADGVLETRIYLGATIGMTHRRPVVVQVRLRLAEDDNLIWVRRCELETNVLDEKAANEAGARFARVKAR